MTTFYPGMLEGYLRLSLDPLPLSDVGAVGVLGHLESTGTGVVWNVFGLVRFVPARRGNLRGWGGGLDDIPVNRFVTPWSEVSHVRNWGVDIISFRALRDGRM